MAEGYSLSQGREENAIGKRIAEFRKSQKMSLDKFCVLLAQRGILIKRSALNKWELGDTVPNGYQLLVLCELMGLYEAPDFFSDRAEFNEEGLRKLREYRKDLKDTGKYAPKKEARYKRMPVSLLSASAGTGDYLDEENFEYLDLPEDEVPDWASFGVHVNGDSMEPVYHDGQLVWIQLCKELRPGEVGLFTLDGCGYIKLYSEESANSADEDGILRPRPVLISYNPNYSPIPVGRESSMQIIGKVL